MTRNQLPDRREAVTIRVRHGALTADATVGFYPSGAIGEIFVNVSSRVGSDIDALARDAAVTLSIAIQHGTPLDTIRHAVTRNADGSPSSIIGALIDGMRGVDP